MIKKKRMHKFICLLLLIAFTFSGNVFAQGKFEKESRLKPKYVPVKALAFIDSLNFGEKVKWHKEEGLTGISVEAKFKHDKVIYSVEFDTSGNVEDIEIEANWKDLESDLRDAIFSQINTDCVKHKIVKVQKQYTGSESQLLSVLKAELKSQNLTIKYELIVRCSHQKKVDLFEYLFNEKGKLISTSQIVFKNSSHLEY
jgi:hypothetical protein